MSDFFWPSIPLTVFADVNKTILIWYDLIFSFKVSYGYG